MSRTTEHSFSRPIEYHASQMPTENKTSKIDTAFSTTVARFFKKYGEAVGMGEDEQDEFSHKDYIEEQERVLGKLSNADRTAQMKPADVSLALSELAGFMALSNPDMPYNRFDDEKVNSEREGDFLTAKKIFMESCAKMFPGTHVDVHADLEEALNKLRSASEVMRDLGLGSSLSAVEMRKMSVHERIERLNMVLEHAGKRMQAYGQEMGGQIKDLQKRTRAEQELAQAVEAVYRLQLMRDQLQKEAYGRDVTPGEARKIDEVRGQINGEHQKANSEVEMNPEPWLNKEREETYSIINADLRAATEQGKSGGQYLAELVNNCVKDYGTKVRFSNWLKPEEYAKIQVSIISSESLNQVAGAQIERPIFVMSDQKLYQRIEDMFNLGGSPSHGVHFNPGLFRNNTPWAKVGFIIIQNRESTAIHEVRHSVDPYLAHGSEKRSVYDNAVAELFAFYKEYILGKKQADWDGMRDHVCDYYSEYARSKTVKMSEAEYDGKVDAAVKSLKVYQEKHGDIAAQRMLVQCKTLDELVTVK